MPGLAKRLDSAGLGSEKGLAAKLEEVWVRTWDGKFPWLWVEKFPEGWAGKVPVGWLGKLPAVDQLE